MSEDSVSVKVNTTAGNEPEWVAIKRPDAEAVAGLVHKARCGKSLLAFSKKTGISYVTLHRCSAQKKPVRPLPYTLDRIAECSEGAVTKDELYKAAGYELKVVERRTPHYVADHLGNRYPSIGEMCRAYGISRQGFYNQRNNGKTLEEILANAVVSKKNPCPKGGRPLKSVTDHLGNRYASLSVMCARWGISCGLYRERLRSGWELERILTAKPHRRAECAG